MSAPAKCSATTGKGTRCKFNATVGELCRTHAERKGRTHGLTDEVQARIVQAIEAGNYQATAARYAGVSESTYYVWLERGRDARAVQEEGLELGDEQRIFLGFLEAVEKARADAEVRSLALIQRAAADRVDQAGNVVHGSWQAAAWYLERSHPSRFGRRDRVEHGGTVRTSTVEIPSDEERIREVTGILVESGALGPEA